LTRAAAPGSLPRVRPTERIHPSVQSTLDQFGETTVQDAFALQNGKLLKVRLDQVTIQAKLGSMVAYQGDVKFEHAGSGGISRMIKKAVSGEGASLMKLSGSGEVFLADDAQDCHLIYLENDKITCNGANVLAFDAGIDWDIEMVKDIGSMISGGLTNMSLSGTGWVALVTHGPPVRLDVGAAPTFADAQSAVVWSSGVKTNVKADMNVKTLIGRGSGETIQVGFEGQGWVLVQPSEGSVAAGPTGQGGVGALSGGLGKLLSG
jgi:uncharacterized protein (AIM24 family)